MFDRSLQELPRHAFGQSGGEVAESRPPLLVSMLVLLAVLKPALALGGNRFGLILPSAIIVLVLLAVRARMLSPPIITSWLWLAIMAWCALQIALGLTPDPGEGARVLVRYALYAAVFILAADLAQSRRRALWAVRMVALWVGALAAFALVAWALGQNPIIGELEAYPTALEGPFVNRNAFALYLGFGAFAALTCLRATGGDVRALLAGGWVWAVIAVACAAALVFCAAFGSEFLRDTATIEDPRFGVQALVLREVLSAPWVGHGIGGFQDSFRASLGGEWRWGDWDHAHQQYLEAAYELGLPAAAAICAAIGLSVPKPRRRSVFAPFALAVLAAAVAHAFVDFSLTIPALSMVLALALGLARRAT